MLAAVAVAVAAATAASPVPTTFEGWAISQGPLGVLCAALAFGWRQERKRADDERAGNQALSAKLVDVVLPALAESTQAVRDVASVLDPPSAPGPRRNRG